ncbi:MAG TPA: oligosaccharide flippase family protein [archaeon]|nr:oligosaccharide flippase family protein [archaeon]
MEASEKRTIIKNIKWLTISKIIVYLLSIITITLIPRYLGVEGYGQLNFIISFVGIFSILGDLGLQTLTVRDISKNPDKASEYFNNLFLFRILISIMFVFMVFIFAIFLPSPPTLEQIIIYTIGIGFFVLGSFNLAFLNGFQEIKYQATSDVIQKTAYAFGVILVVIFNYKLFGIIVASAISSVFLFVFSFFAIKRFIKIKKLKLNKKYIKEKIIFASPFILTSIFWMIYFNIDRIFITYFKGNYATGLYSISYTFIGFLLGIIGIFNTVFFPVLSNVSSNKQKLKSIVDKYLLLMYIFCIPVTVGGIYLAPKIISLVFGSQYLGGTLAFQLIMFFFLLNSIGIINYHLLITNNLEKYSLKILGLSAAINILLNFIFVPWFGIIGAAITTIISEIIIFLLSYKKIKSDIIKINYLSSIIKPIVASGIMLFGLILFNVLYPTGILHNNFDVLISIIIGGVVYIAILFTTRVITLNQIKELLKNE